MIGTIHEDVTTEALGEIGAWQWLVTFISTLFMTSSFFQHYEYVFLLKPNRVHCVISEEYEIQNESLCSYTLTNGTEVQCENWHMKILWIISVNKSWILFCDDKMKLLLTAVIFQMGTIFGFIFSGLIADSFGRKNAVILNISAVMVLSAVEMFCNSESWFRLVLFLKSLFAPASMFITLILVSEIASNAWRSWLCMIAMSPRLLAFVSTVFVANLFSNVETYGLIGGLLSVILISVLKYLPESPQWMLFNRKIHLAEQLLSKAVVKNKIIYSAEFKIRPVDLRAYMALDERTSCFRIFRFRNLRVLIIVSLVIWGVFNFIWGFLFLKVYSTHDSLIIVLQVLFYFCVLGLISLVLSKYIRLRGFLAINIGITAVFTIGVFIMKHQILHGIISSLALASGLMIHALLLLMTPRFFAINVRATLFGCCNAIGQLGFMISYVVFIHKAVDDVTFIPIELTLYVTVLLLTLVLPTVDGRELPDVMGDMNYFHELSKPLRWATQKHVSASKEEVEMRVYSYASAPTTSTSIIERTSQTNTLSRRQTRDKLSLWQRILKHFRRLHVIIDSPSIQFASRKTFFTHSQGTQSTFQVDSVVNSIQSDDVMTVSIQTPSAPT